MIKCIASDGSMIIGYKMSTATLDRIQRLLLEARKGGELDYIGSAVTGLARGTPETLGRRSIPG